MEAVKLAVNAFGATVREAEPLLDWYDESPAKLAPTPVEYVPAAMFPRLTPLSVATPEAFVVALPTEVPLSVKLTVFPLTATAPDMRVAERLTVPPYAPDAPDAVSVVAAAEFTVSANADDELEAWVLEPP